MVSNPTNSKSSFKLGVVPEEIFTNHTFSRLLGNANRDSDFITIVISNPEYVSATTSIIGIIKDDSLNMSFGSKFTRPMQNIISDAVQKVGGNIASLASQVMSVSGTPLYNRYASVPVWQMPELSNKRFSFTLIATSHAASQVEMPLLLLSRLVLPKQKNTYSVVTPGPKVQASTEQIFSELKNTTQGNAMNVQGFIDANSAVSIQYGGLAYFNNCVITNVSYTVYNNRTTDYARVVSDTPMPYADDVPFYTWAEVEIDVMPYYPPEYMGDAGNNLGDIKLFYESSGIDKYSNFK